MDVEVKRRSYVKFLFVVFGKWRQEMGIGEKLKKREISLFDQGFNHRLACQLESLVEIINKKDAITSGHSSRVALLAGQIAKQLGSSEEIIEKAEIAGLVHDVGKIGIPQEILSKKGSLTADEMTIMRQHPRIGWEILKDVRSLEPFLDGILYHHERFDGRGYPYGLKENQIPLMARILSVADSYDAMTTSRPYRKPMSSKRALIEIMKESGAQFAPQIVKALIVLQVKRYESLEAA